MGFGGLIPIFFDSMVFSIVDIVFGLVHCLISLVAFILEVY
jgi:hypothetical protein